MFRDALKIRFPLLLIVLSLSFFILCDVLIFRSGLYSRQMKANDVGTLYFRVTAKMNPTLPATKNLLLVGNSQVERGFLATQFEQTNQKAGINIVRLDAPKTYEQIWYYALKYNDPNHNKYKAILITLPDYKIEPFSGFGQEEQYATATFLAPFIGITDWIDVIGGYRSSSMRYRVAALAIFASHRYSFDLQDLLIHPLTRIEENRSREIAGNDWDKDPPIVPGAWRDLQIRDGKVSCPLTYAQFDCIGGVQNALRPVSAEAAAMATLRNEAYEKEWLGKIIGLYKDSQTRLFFVQMPRWPIPLPERTPVPSGPDVRKLFANEPNVTFLDENLFSTLENPVYMHDHVHVSTEARQLFTEILGREIVKFMEPL